MKTGKMICTIILFVALMGPALVYGGTDEFDKAMHPVLEEYLRIHDALA